MKIVVYYRCPETLEGPEEVVRVEVFVLCNKTLNESSFLWCYYGESVLKDIPKPKSELGEILSIHDAAAVLGKENGWTQLFSLENKKPELEYN